MNKHIFLLISIVVVYLLMMYQENQNYIDTYYEQIGVYDEKVYFFISENRYSIWTNEKRYYIAYMEEDSFVEVMETAHSYNIAMYNNIIHYTSYSDLNENNENKQVIYNVETNTKTEYYGVAQYTTLQYLDESYAVYYNSYRSNNQVLIFNIQNQELQIVKYLSVNEHRRAHQMIVDDDKLYLVYYLESGDYNFEVLVYDLITKEYDNIEGMKSRYTISIDEETLFLVFSNWYNGVHTKLLIENQTETLDQLQTIYNGEMIISDTLLISHSYDSNEYIIYDNTLQEVDRFEVQSSCEYTTPIDETKYICMMGKELGVFHSKYYRKYLILEAHTNSVLQETDWILVGEEKSRWNFGVIVE